MDIQLQVQIPFSWDVLPFPNISSPLEHYEVVVRFRFPSVLAKLFGFDCVSDVERVPLPSQPVEPSLVKEVRTLLESGKATLVLSDEGTGGTYIVQSITGEPLAVFKPSDEEPGAENNPKKLVQNPLLPRVEEVCEKSLLT